MATPPGGTRVGGWRWTLESRASYAQADAGQWSATEEANLRAAAAEIDILAGPNVSGPAQDLVEVVLEVHKGLAAGEDAARARVPDVNRERLKLKDLFKADLGLKD
ncbi:hypothetical protein [Virgisporangium aurantiacum]|uniref:Uncharacterized protein n=1 Tax=Virgisporangium aurantiacum TaxID=175570 RepID=A0A8J4E209_9ACTN|nr:hypothetical protein [Virgisporangium aurantiacum]GIJ58481.1 hypothetical protein Vau01_059970 [Virgisporangium aurantiacum]